MDRSGRRSFDYPEITGYALTYLAGRESLSEGELATGARAAEWLTARVQAGNLAARDGWDSDAVYLFDLGMIASGLLSFGRRSGVDRFVRAGLDLVRFLDGELGSGGALSSVAAAGPPSERRTWSTRGAAHLAKLVQALLLAEERPVGLLERVKILQREDGRFVTDSDTTTTMLHPHLYAAEGLWIWGSASGDSDSLERARAAVEWTWTHQLEQGGLPASVADGDPGGRDDEQCDVTAQAVRLALVLGLRAPPVDRAVERLLELASGDDQARGIVYRPAAPDRHVNTWATLFAAQALTLAASDSPVLSWQELV